MLELFVASAITPIRRIAERRAKCKIGRSQETAPKSLLRKSKNQNENLKAEVKAGVNEYERCVIARSESDKAIS